MGGRLVIPEADPKTERAIKLYEFNPREIAKFWKLFQTLDKMKIGFIKLEDIYAECEYQRNVYTDALCSLLEIEVEDGEINFNDFLLIVSTYCMFEIAEILRFCVFLFDQDRSGMCEIEDVKEIMNILNNIIAPATVRGTIKKGWLGVTFDADGNVDFKQMMLIYKQFPRLFQPAFRLQQQMMIRFMGTTWWERKKLRNKDNREKAERILAKKKQKKLDKIQAKKNRAIKRNMGILKYV
jgi:Ca2+-binding EF-hand superfamily protein